MSPSDWIQLGVAIATLILAGSTVLMACYVKDQASETGRLARISERQFESTTTPVVRIMRDEEATRADMVTVNEGMADESLTVRIENHGVAPAEIENCTMVPGGQGKLADAGTMTSPTLVSDGEWDVEFHPSVTDKEAHEKGQEVCVQLVYLAIRSGARYRTRTYLKRSDDDRGEGWTILREEAPCQLGVVVTG
jgi:hypothetical protein